MTLEDICNPRDPSRCRYTATIQHHSISRARIVDVGNNLTMAKRLATAEFGGGFLDHTIVIFDAEIPGWDNICAARKLCHRRWQDNAPD